MLRLYIGNKNYSSWSLRPWVLMQTLDIPFEEKLVPFSEAESFRTFSPTGKVPCLHDGDTVIWDSLSIVEYLAERFPMVWPADAGARAWARCAAAEMHSGFDAIRSICPMNCGVRVRLATPPAVLDLDLARLDALWSEGLSRFGGPFLAGAAFSAVDAFFAPVAFRIQTYDLALSAAARQYANTLLGLPAMQAWYTAALAEVWRDEEHEQEVQQAGSLVEDFRQAARN